MLHAMILAGGQGTRLWPSSRSEFPKQFLSLISERTMLQEAYDRLAPLVPAKRVLVATGRRYADIVTTQLPELPHDNVIGEAEGKGTAAAIGLVAAILVRRDPDATMVVVTADHLIRDVSTFQAAIAAGVVLADDDWLVTLGIRPSRPDTGFGYLERGEFLGECGGMHAFRVARFVEKPDAETASRFVSQGQFDWNSGMFIWKAHRVLAELQRSMPDLYEGITAISSGLHTGTPLEHLDSIWRRLPVQTLDYGVMEKAQDVAMLPVDIGWSDVGTWETMYEVLPHDDAGNAVRGRHTCIDSAGSLVVSKDRLVATIGIDNLVIVDTDDVLLICSRDRVQDVRRLVAAITEQRSPNS